MGCSPFIDQGQPQVDSTVWQLSAGQSIGQSFSSSQAGLSAIEIYLAPDQPGPGKLSLHLRESPQETRDLATATLNASTVTRPGFYTFYFQPQAGSYLHDYYLLLEMDGRAKLKIGSAASSAYQEGSLYQNEAPVDAQLSFRPLYGKRLMSLGLLKQGLTWSWQTLLAGLLFIIPGWALLSWLWSGWTKLNWVEKSGLAGGVSLALYPILLLWADLIHLKIGAWAAWAPMLAGLGYLGWYQRNGFGDLRVRYGKTGLSLPWRSSNPRISFPGLVSFLLVGLIILVSLWAIRTLDIPLWGDAYQHTLIAQLIVDNRGLFNSWLPYIPYNTLTVQYGFSACAAAYAWLARVSVPQATLLTGQFINILAVLALYPLAKRLSHGNPWAGCAALLVGGLLSPSPMNYLNWGRYAQLSGEAILPVGIWLLWETLDRLDRVDWKKVFIIGFTLAGMLLVYYRMAFSFAAFFCAWLVGWGLTKWGTRLNNWKQFFLNILSVGIISVLLVSPWLIRVSGSTLASSVETGISTGTPLNNVLQDYATWQQITDFLPAYLILFSVAAIVWALAKKDWMAASMALWVIILAGIKAGSLIKLPGANMMQSFTVLIGLYIPASLLVGWLVAQIIEGFPSSQNKYSSLVQAAAALVLIAGALYGVVQQKNVPDTRDFGLVHRPDLRSMQWIQANTPSTARFLVEGFSIYAGTSVVGSDAGWWISLLGRRQNTMPPQYALINEIPDPKDYSQRITSLVTLLEKQPITQADSLSLMCKEGIDYVYIGQEQGIIGAGAHQLYSPQDLLTSSLFNLVYRQDRVWIFSMKPEACAN